jgi:hypothetical protein
MAAPNPWDTSGTANSLADAIRRQAAAQSQAATTAKVKKENGGVAPANPLDQLMKQIQNINVSATPFDQLMQQASGSAGAQFNPLIEQLKGEMARTEKRGKANQGQAKAMYNDLATDIAGEMPQITEQMNQASQETQQRYESTQAQLKGQYDQQAQQQAQLYKQLGIQAATGGASQQASDDQAYFQNQSNTDEAAALQLLQQMKQSDVSYNQQSSDNTRLAGVNTAADIGAQLEDYMQTAGSKMTGLTAGRDSAIQAMMAQLQQQDQQRMADQEESQYSRLMDMFNLQLKMQEMQQSAAKKSSSANDQLFKGTNGPNGSANYLGEMYGQGDTFTSNSIQELLNQVMSTPEAQAGKYQSPDMKDSYGNPVMLETTPDYLSDKLRGLMQNPDASTNFSAPDYSEYDINNAISALLARMGKLK